MTRYEPAAVIASIAAILQAAILVGLLPEKLDTMGISSAIVVLTTVVAGFFIRHKVVPVRKLEDAGIDPVQVNRDVRDMEAGNSFNN
jgi:hypothetical protein